MTVPSPVLSTASETAFIARDGFTRGIVLPLVILAEILVFSLIGTNFCSAANAFEVLRLSVEIGLLAVALTPVITTGGIDISVGSLMGLSAVVFGGMWRDAGVPIPVAAVLTLMVGASAGCLNGLLINARKTSSFDRDAWLVFVVPWTRRGNDGRCR